VCALSSTTVYSHIEPYENDFVEACEIGTLRSMSAKISSLLIPKLKLPRTTPAITRLSAARSPLRSPFIRYSSTGGEEKVKGQVIGIDLGALKNFLQRLPQNLLTSA